MPVSPWCYVAKAKHYIILRLERIAVVCFHWLAACSNNPYLRLAFSLGPPDSAGGDISQGRGESLDRFRSHFRLLRRGLRGSEVSRNFHGDMGQRIFSSFDVRNSELARRLDPLACFRDARVGANGADDGARSDDLDFIDALDEVSEREAKIVVAARKEPSGVGMAIDGRFFEIMFAGNLVGALPVEEDFVDGFAFRVVADGAFAFVARRFSNW